MSEANSVNEPIAENAASAPRAARKAWKWLPLALPVLFALGVGAAFAVDERAARGFDRGTWLLGQNLSHLDRATAEQKLNAEAKRRSTRPMTVKFEREERALSAASFGFSFDVSAMLTRAEREQAARDQAQHFGHWLRSLCGRDAFPAPIVRMDASVFEAALSELERNALKAPFAGGFHAAGGTLVADYARTGQRFNRAAAQQSWREALEAHSPSVTLPTLTLAPPVANAAIDRLVSDADRLTRGDVTLTDAASGKSVLFRSDELLNTVRVVPPVGAGEPQIEVDAERLLAALGERLAAVESVATPARFEITPDDHVKIVPSTPERRVAREQLSQALLAAAAEANRSGALPLVAGNQPEFTTAAAEALGIRGLVSTFTTRHPCCERRVENIHRIADLLNGLLVKPGDTVSVNAIIGPRTAKNGFVPAPTIEEGEMVETLGGGISQFATTLFNALFHGGYDIIERQPHSYWFPRYPMGHEATLSFPKPDLIFRNDTNAGMLFDMKYTDRSITVRIFGDNGGRRVEAKVSERQNIIPAPVEILPNRAIAPDKEHTLQGGMIGWSVIVARIIHLPDGTKKEERRKVTYKPKVRRIEVHPCRVPEGEKGYTGERCPLPEDSEASASQ